MKGLSFSFDGKFCAVIRCPFNESSTLGAKRCKNVVIQTTSCMQMTHLNFVQVIQKSREKMY
jgi:hypothetical protein